MVLALLVLQYILLFELQKHYIVLKYETQFRIYNSSNVALCITRDVED